MEILSVFSTVLGSSLLVAVVTHWLTLARAQKERTKQKLEEVFACASEFKYELSFIGLRLQQIKLKEVDYKVGLPHITELNFSCIKHYDKVLMLSHTYFPELVSLWEPFLLQRKKFSEVIGQFVQFGKEIPDKDYIDFANCAGKINDQFGVFINKIFEIAKTVEQRSWFSLS